MKEANPSVEKIAGFVAKMYVTKRPLYDTLAGMKNQPKIERVALYARVSTKDGRQDTENQLIALREYCAKQGWQIAGEYVDHETGGHSRRPHCQRMFADARTLLAFLHRGVLGFNRTIQGRGDRHFGGDRQTRAHPTF